MPTLDANCRLCGQEVSWAESSKEPGKVIMVDPGTTTPHTESCTALNRKAPASKKRGVEEFASTEAQAHTKELSQGAPTPATQEAIVSPTQSKAFCALDLAEVERTTGIPRGFIMMMGERGKERPFVLSEGLLFKAEQKGYRSIQLDVKEVRGEKGELLGYHATAELYPKLSKDDYEVLKHLPADPATAAIIVKELLRPFREYGTATFDNVKMKTMHPYMKELAITRARNRVLRLFTACGLTSVEELADAEIQEPD